MSFKLFDNPIIDIPHPVGEGVQKIYKFDNNYGASVVRFKIFDTTYGSYTSNEDEWELAVIKFEPDTDDWNLTYDTSITDDVLGRLTTEDVEETLQKIKELP